jgi:hypothetical protein
MADSTSDFSRQTRRNRVFILGAGFSAGAGLPLTEGLLASALAKFAVECPGLYSRVEGYAADTIGLSDSETPDLSKVGFSELCTYLEFIELKEYGRGERWSDNGSREKMALRFYLAKTLAERTPPKESIPQLYRDFAAQLHEADVVISLNWDGLLEVALQAVGKTYTYNGSDPKAIKLFKLYGSVNWRLGEPNRLGVPADSLSWKSLDFTKGMMSREIYYTEALLRFSTWDHYSPLGEVDPFLVLPGYGKAFDVRDNAPLWYKPEWAFAFTHDVYLIGLGLAQDDFFVRSLFLSTLPHLSTSSSADGRRIFIINPDPNANKHYDFVLSKGHAELMNTRFLPEHIELMNKRLSESREPPSD